jgi:hypothetical protein
MTNIGVPARCILFIAGVILSWGSPGEIGTQSKGADSWSSETSFAALQLRALGALKMGAGLGLIGVSLLGVAGQQVQGAAHQLASQAAAKTEPKPQLKVQYPTAIPKPPQIQ